MDLGLDDRTAIVTGGAGRIGSEDCKVLAEEGAEVIVLDVNESAAADVADTINDGEYDGSAIDVACDLTDRDDVGATVEAVVEETGGIDILVNNAGLVDANGKLEEFDDDLWDRDVAINLTGAYNITRAVYPHMVEQGWGRMIHMSSVAGKDGGFGQISYSSTKAAFIGFGKSIALEGARHNITSNVLAPSIVVSALADLPQEQLEEINPLYARMVDATPAGHLGREADVANFVAYLCSDHASYVTGQVIGITGGIDLLSY